MPLDFNFNVVFVGLVLHFSRINPYEKSSYNICPKNIQLNSVHFQYILLYNKCAKNCNKSHNNRIGKIVY